jgi:hypothetical protein
MAQVVEHICSKCKALSLNPSSIQGGGGRGKGGRKKRKKIGLGKQKQNKILRVWKQ